MCKAASPLAKFSAAVTPSIRKTRKSTFCTVNEEGKMRAYNAGGIAFVPFTGLGVKGYQTKPKP